jgi:DNA-binding HxlR family transcriptional regulator
MILWGFPLKKRTYSLSVPGCPVEATLDMIGGKFKGMILFHLLDGTKRFGELRKHMPTVTQRTMTLQLRELEAIGIIHREVYAIVPPKTEYSLTEFGRSLEPVLRVMQEWGSKNMDQITQAIRAAGE